MRKNIGFNKVDKIIFGFIIWIFYIVSTVLIVKIIIPQYVRHVFWLNYTLGFIIMGYWFLTDSLRKLTHWSGFQIRVKLAKLTLGGTLPIMLPMIAFIVLITLYTPLIYQYDALAMYLIEGRQLVEDFAFLARTWPTFGDSMPVMPILYSWFFYLSDTPLLRLIPLSLFFLTMFLVYAMAHKLSPRNSYVAYISLVSLVSMTSLQWYMANTSLYIDLCFMFFSASSIYALMITFENKYIKVNFLILGINIALLLLTKEYGVFHAWFIFGYLVFFRYNKITKNFFYSLFYSLFLIIPFSLRNFSYLIIYTFAVNIDITLAIIFISFIIFLSLFIQTFIFMRGELKYIKFNLSSLIIVIIPLIIPILFFINNLLVLGSPLANLTETYIESLYELDIVFTESIIKNISFFNIPNLFLSNGLLAMNLLPLLFFLLFNLLIPQIHRIQDKHSKLLTSWFFYFLLLFFFVTNGYIKEGYIRRALILAIPIALTVGKGIHNLIEHYSLPNYTGNLIYISSISIFLSYIWFIKLDVTKWWQINFNSLNNNLTYAQPIEVILYAAPWLLLFLLIIISKNIIDLSKLQYKKIRFKASVIIILMSIITPSIIFSQAIKYPNTWDPSYYDKADSVKSHTNHWYIPIIDFYRYQLNSGNSTTIGFGVTPIQYFLERPFIDLNHPRNWLLYLPLFQELSVDELLSYLDTLDARYFLIPSEIHGSRSRYEAALKKSTLFKLIETSEVFIGTDGKMYQLQRLAEFSPLVLYVLTQIPTFIPIDMESGEYYSDQEYDYYRLYYDENIKKWQLNG